MRYMKLSMARLLMFGLPIICMAHRANATVMYSYVSDQANYSVLYGQTVTVNVYLKETLTQGSTSLLNSAHENGLYSASFAVTAASNVLPSPSVVTGAAADSAEFDGGSSFTVASHTSTTAHVNNSQGLSPDAAGVQLGNQPTLAGAVTTPANEVFLGTITITAGYSIAATTFNLGELNLSHGNTITYADDYDLDKNSANPAYSGVGTAITSFTVTATPEPCAVVVFLLGGVGCLIRRRA